MEKLYSSYTEGRYDLIVHLLAADIQHLRALELDHFTSHPAVARVETSIIFESRQRFETPVYLGGQASS